MAFKLVRFPIAGGYRLMIAGRPSLGIVDFSVREHQDEWVVLCNDSVYGYRCMGHSPNKATAHAIMEETIDKIEEHMPCFENFARAVEASR